MASFDGSVQRGRSSGSSGIVEERYVNCVFLTTYQSINALDVLPETPTENTRFCATDNGNDMVNTDETRVEISLGGRNLFGEFTPNILF